MDNLPTDGLLAPGLACLCLALFASGLPTNGSINHKVISDLQFKLSPMGRVAQKFSSNPVISSGYMEGPAINKGQLSLASDSTATHIVAGFNDPRGFADIPISTCGYMISDDGGQTFEDCGRLISPSGVELFGHPQVRYMGGSSFIYTSLMVRQSEGGSTVQTIALFRSNDFGHDWNGPFEVAPASESILSDPGAADKEFIDVDPQTGRVLIAWTAFHSGVDSSPTDICATYSDDVLTNEYPTWSAKAVLNTGSKTVDEGGMPRFGKGGDAYIAWSETLPGTRLKNIAICRSADGGETWSAPINLRPSFFPGMDQVIGGDSTSDFPCLAVDQSSEATSGSIYVAYTDNSSRDGADVVLQKSLTGGRSFSNPISLSPSPGTDGEQWFPWVCVDTQTGKVCVFYFNQQGGKTGDLTDAMVTFSEDGGDGWSAPSCLLDKPFHAAAGANAGEPNLGEYHEILSVGGHLLTMVPLRPDTPEFSEASERSRSALLDFGFRDVASGSLPVRLERVSACGLTDKGSIQPGDTVDISLTLRDFVTNLHMSPRVITHLHGHVSTTTPGITVTRTNADFSDVTSGSLATNRQPFEIEVADDFDVGTPIDLHVDLRGAEGAASLEFSLRAGTVSEQQIFAETFAATSGCSLPKGWIDSTQSGAAPSAWRIAQESVPGLFHSTFCGDLTGKEDAVFESVASPAFEVPKRSESVSIDFDISYNTDTDPLLNRSVYAGCALRVIQQTAQDAESRLASSIASEIVISSRGMEQAGYPAHLPESPNSSYCQNIDVWGGRSRGTEHVHMVISCLTGEKMRLRWDYTEDPLLKGSIDLSSGITPGVLISNLVVCSQIRSAEVLKRTLATSGAYELNQDGFVRASLAKLVHPTQGVCAPTTFAVDREPAHGHLYLHPDGLFMYQPLNGFCGQDHFSYSLSDMGSQISIATVYLSVDPVVKAILCPNRLKPSTSYLAKVVLGGLAPPDGLIVKLSVDRASLMKVPVTVDVSPFANEATFEFRTEASGEASTAEITAKLHGVEKSVKVLLSAQRYPAASDHSFSAYQGEKLQMATGCLFSGAKTERSGELIARQVSSAQHGAVQVQNDGSFAYVPAAGYSGPDSFKYEVLQSGNFSDPATVELEVFPAIKQVGLAHDVLLSGTKSSATLVLGGMVPAVGETVTLKSSDPSNAPMPATIVVPGGVSSYSFDFATRSVSSPERVQITATVHLGSATSAIDLRPNRAIESHGFLYRLSEDEPLIISGPGLLQGALDPNPHSDGKSEPMRALLVGNPAHGIATVGSDGSFRYTPGLDFVGADSFSFKIVGESSASDPQTVQIWVEPSLAGVEALSLQKATSGQLEGRIKLSAQAKVEGLRVSLESSRPELLEVPEAVLVRQGDDEASFKFFAHPVSVPVSIYIKANLNGIEKETMVILRPDKGLEPN